MGSVLAGESGHAGIVLTRVWPCLHAIRWPGTCVVLSLPTHHAGGWHQRVSTAPNFGRDTLRRGANAKPEVRKIVSANTICSSLVEYEINPPSSLIRNHDFPWRNHDLCADSLEGAVKGHDVCADPLEGAVKGGSNMIFEITIMHTD
jgi:hypothetical protein